MKMLSMILVSALGLFPAAGAASPLPSRVISRGQTVSSFCPLWNHHCRR